ncbi:MAG TPA: IclR family transcriptional regulator [Ktedonobacteraceae bacterium]|nr:IclR family transcriptional regulator [Ktedonobacteraceae bacterium]
MVQSAIGEEQRNPGGVQVIERAAKILRTLRGKPEGMSLSQIAREVGLARSTVHRIVLALEAEHFVTTVAPNGRIRLGLGLSTLAASVNSSLLEELHPYMKQLSEEANETVDLAILDHDHVFFIDQITVRHRLQAVSAVGTTFPLHCTANGKALLAELPNEAIERLLPERLQPFTPHTITSRRKLLEALELIRAERVSFDREEHMLGICAVGIALADILGNLFAITIPLPSIRFLGNEHRLASMLKSTCNRIKSDWQAS